MKLNVNAFGLACGILWGLMVAVLTLTNIWWAYPGSWMNLIADIYKWGYNPTAYSGMIVGLIYGFVDGYIGGAIFAWLYNKLVKK